MLCEASLKEGEEGLDQLPGFEPTPEFAASVVKEYQKRLEALGDETLKRVALSRLEGYSV